MCALTGARARAPPDTGFFLSDHTSVQVQLQGAMRYGAVLRDGHRNGPLLIATNVRDLFEKPRSAIDAIRYELLQNMMYF